MGPILDCINYAGYKCSSKNRVRAEKIDTVLIVMGGLTFIIASTLCILTNKNILPAQSMPSINTFKLINGISFYTALVVGISNYCIDRCRPQYLIA